MEPEPGATLHAAAGTAVATGAAQVPAPELGKDHVDAIVAAMRESRAPETLRAYTGAWRRFRAWCEAEGYGLLPAAPGTVAAYLAIRAARGASPATVRMDRAAIRAAHLQAGAPTPTDSPGISRVMRGLVRKAAGEGRAPPRQAAALTAESLSAIRATARTPRTGPTGRTESIERASRRGEVDIAIAATMRDAMLRRSEAAALTWGDVELRPDGSGRLHVRRSKTDQEGAGAVQYLGPAAAKALRLIRPEDAEPAARVFGLTGRSLSNRLRAMAAAAGLEGAFSGHSGRVGMARDLVASGASVSAVQVAGRWASSRMPAHYARSELAGRGAVARYYGG